MARMKVGDRVIITEGDFKGERGAIVEKKLLTDGIRVALEKNGKEIKTEEAHVSLADWPRSRAAAGDRLLTHRRLTAPTRPIRGASRG